MDFVLLDLTASSVICYANVKAVQTVCEVHLLCSEDVLAAKWKFSFQCWTLLQSSFFLILSFYIRKWEHLGDGSALRPTHCSLFGFLTLADESSQLDLWIWCSVVCNTPTRCVYGSMTQQWFQDFAYKTLCYWRFFARESYFNYYLAFNIVSFASIFIWLKTFNRTRVLRSAKNFGLYIFSGVSPMQQRRLYHVQWLLLIILVYYKDDCFYDGVLFLFATTSFLQARAFV